MSWWESPAGRGRLERDRASLALRQPGLRLSVGDHVEARGKIVIEVGESEVVLSYAIRLVFPDDYPASPPTAYDDGNGLDYVADRHLYPDGGCCLWLDVAPRWSSLDPDGLTRFIDEDLAVFYVRQWLYDAGKGWVGPAYSHGLAAYLEYAADRGLTMEQLRLLLPAILGEWDEGARPCPCRSGGAFWLCHREFALTFRRADPEALRVFAEAIKQRPAAPGLLAPSRSRRRRRR